MVNVTHAHCPKRTRPQGLTVTSWHDVRSDHCLVVPLPYISIACNPLPSQLEPLPSQPLTSPANSSLAEMTSHSPRKPRGMRFNISIFALRPGRALRNHSTAAGILAVSKPILAFNPSQLPLVPKSESTVVSVSSYRYASDIAQTFLPPIQAVADAIPGVGGIIKGVIGGMLSTLQLVDVILFRYRLGLSLTLNCTAIEIRPEQGRHKAAQTAIVPPSPPFRRCTHCSNRFRGNHETAVAQVCGSQKAWFN